MLSITFTEYKRRLVELFGSTYRKMNYMLAMSVFNPKINFVEQDPASVSSEFLNFLKFVLEPHEMKRLEAYTNSQIDHPLIRDVAQKLARMYFLEHLPVSLSYDQASILFCYGLQHKDISEIETKMEPHSISVDEDLYNAAKEVQDEMKAKSEGLLDPELFQQFAIVDREAEFGNALRNGGGKIVPGSVVSVESKKFKLEKHSNPETEKSGKKRSKDRSGLKSSKKRRS